MEQSIFDKYKSITERIVQEEDEYTEQLISNLGKTFLNTVETDSNYNGFRINNRFMMLALRCYHICLGYDMLISGNRQMEEVIISDLKSIIEIIENLEYKGMVDWCVISDTIDCVCAINGNEYMGNIVGKYLPEEYQGFYRTNISVSENLIFLISNLAEVFFKSIDEGIAVTILEYLVLISRERNGPDSIEHREIVLSVVKELADSYPGESYNICSVEKDTFIKYKDEYAADFLWFWGCILHKKGKTKSAYKAFVDCYKLRQLLIGTDNWYTALAKREYIVLKLFLDNFIKTNEVEYLEYFIKTIEDNRYSQINSDMVKVVEGKTLYTLLLYKMKMNDFDLLYHYIELYGRICEEYNNLTSEPLVKIRLYYNFLGNYHIKRGDYIKAEKAFFDAINAILPDGTVEILTTEQIKYNLLMVYYSENDMGQAWPVLLELLERIDSEKSGLSVQDEFRVLSLYNSILSQSFIELEKEEIDDLKDDLSDLYCEIMYNNLLDCEYAAEMIMYILTSIQLLMQNGCVIRDECMKHYMVLQKIKSQNEEINLDNGQQVVMYLIFAKLAWEMDEQQAAEDNIIKCVELLGDIVLPLNIRVAVLQTASVILCKRGKNQLGMRYLKESLGNITEIWHSYMRYCNDTRLLQILSPVQLLFSCCYAVMREFESTSVLYEKVLQYKALASLTGKERNYLLNNSNTDNILVEEIRKAQNRMAVLESENIFLNTSKEYNAEKVKMRNLEIEFAEKFQIDTVFTDITLRNVMREIPSNTIVVEYYLTANGYGKYQYESDTMVFDVFVLSKQREKCSLERVVISDAERIQEEVRTFVEILMEESVQKATVSRIEIKERLCFSLYKKLIKPVMPFLNDTENIFIAPDSSIMNLPFDILCDENGNLFGDNFNVVKMECARDFLFGGNSKKNSSGSLIVGNPLYEIKDNSAERVIQNDDTKNLRYAKLRTENIHQLPFSELEAQMVGKYCNERYLSGKKANKQLLIAAGTKKNIHIATHGYYDISEDTNTMYSSCLLFAGVKNWLQFGMESETYGNGIVTADEISRLEFKGVELVVLSSCLSGMNENLLAKGFQGLLGGFSAAGVKYVVANLWNADDFGTAVLMDLFYYQYQVKKLAPPEALRNARQYLRNVTIGDLKAKKWFEYILLNEAISDDMKKTVRSYMAKNEKYRPFKNEIYWAGFTCYRCN